MVIETIIDWAIPEKRGLRIWNFQGCWRNGKWILQGLIKNNMEFQKCQKREKYLTIWAKVYKNWKYFEKGQVIACNKLLEYALSMLC